MSALPAEAAPAAKKKAQRGGTLYRGNEGMWSWVLHRITGVAIFFFLLVHVLDTALIRVSPEAYNAVMSAYKTPIMGLGEAALVAAIVFHAFNGLRIILVDYWSKGAKYHKTMFWIVIVLWAVTMAGFLPRHLMNVFSH
ncbi:succinate dehydrogenase, cytochrome b556 subunit [Leucobacter sp. BZR 635]|uniref:succinate dehydrogenase, cytochrome b556 subunit n=1 Tax=Leucobacter sp. BZR 635 TaxID=3378705 RepID=UPI003A862B14